MFEVAGHNGGIASHLDDDGEQAGGSFCRRYDFGGLKFDWVAPRSPTKRQRRVRGKEKKGGGGVANRQPHALYESYGSGRRVASGAYLTMQCATANECEQALRPEMRRAPVKEDEAEEVEEHVIDGPAPSVTRDLQRRAACSHG